MGIGGRHIIIRIGNKAGLLSRFKSNLNGLTPIIVVPLHLKVKMCTRGPTGIIGQCNRLSPLDRITLRNQNTIGFNMKIPSKAAVLMANS